MKRICMPELFTRLVQISGRTESVKWQDVIGTEELICSFLKELDSEAITNLVAKV